MLEQGLELVLDQLLAPKLKWIKLLLEPVLDLLLEPELLQPKLLKL